LKNHSTPFELQGLMSLLFPLMQSDLQAYVENLLKKNSDQSVPRACNVESNISISGIARPFSKRLMFDLETLTRSASSCIVRFLAVRSALNRSPIFISTIIHTL